MAPRPLTSTAQPIIYTTHGRVCGQRRRTIYNDEYYCFDGIPYAKPPLGELRFKSPRPANPWVDVRICTTPPPKSVQFNRYTNRIEGSEDCLYLNIYAKELKSKEPLPVIVFIHGGGFTTGGACRQTWGPDYFMMANVVLVTIGYRLGALGFLHFPEPELEVPGNAGLKDIIMALEWLKSNYCRFNGDPTNVTLFGHSSGSMAVQLLITVPKCEGLFHKAILMSGFSLHIQDHPERIHQYVTHIGYRGVKDNKKILKYLCSLKAEKLCDLKFLVLDERDQGTGYIFFPCIENPSVPDAIITKNPLDMLADEDAWYHDIPLMMGSTTAESMVRYKYLTENPEVYKVFGERPEYLVPQEVSHYCDLTTQKKFAKKLIKLHLGEKSLSAAHVMEIINLLSYGFMYHPLHRLVNSRLIRSQAPTYLYRFDFDSPRFNLYRIKLCGPNVRGVCHADDLGYLFYMPESFKLERNSDELKIIRVMVDLLTSFAAVSDPNSMRLHPIHWYPRASCDTCQCFHISRTISFVEWPELENCEQWDKLYMEFGLSEPQKVEELLTLPLGTIRGRQCKSIYDHKYYSFEGIPYAEPPLGALRFRAPKPVAPWTDIKNCTQCASKPLQNNPLTNEVEGSEDCLYLNVYTKKLKSENPLPVMVFIYGGAYSIGEATRELYGPDYFMSEDVVLVTFNYRLCSLGFLSLADPTLQIPGNAGLKDQVLALKWVKTHISHFNGNPENVTIFGESAGAASVHLLMLSEQGNNLFKRGIAMSGCALNYWANMPQTNMAYRLAKFHGYTGENIDKAVFQYLNELEPNKLVVHSLLNEEEQRNLYMFAFAPIVEPYVAEGCVIPERPFNMLKKAWSNKLSMMIGGSSFEGLFLYKVVKSNPDIMKRFYNEPELLLPEEVRSMHDKKKNRKMGQKMLALYFGDEAPNDSALLKYLEILSYKLFWHDIHRTIMARLSFALAPTFLYRFDFDSPDFNLNRAKICGTDQVRGVAHADELSYLFYSRQSHKLLSNSAEYKTIRRLIGMWTAYAKNGDPDCDESNPIVWDAVSKYCNLRAMNIGNELEFKEVPEKEKLKVWADLYTGPSQLCGASSVTDYDWGKPIPTII
ncbi:uncharacterized protein LOC129252884 [Anastrepha obliqua]|uniref:uncharacterized protein LOC129252884 n=1 Tax=Anastrepha obliqua TaxID=95512 RepID=UPI002408F287|nr:uncharacterized protein LOC129252884 [Anastrepha obliqua]